METAYEVLRQAQRVGYVFSGGSARCAFQIGAIEALAELGIEPALTRQPLARVGYLRTGEVLTGEQYPETFIRARGEAPSAKFSRALQSVRRAHAIIVRQL